MPTAYIRTLLARSHAATHRTQLLLSRCRLPEPAFLAAAHEAVVDSEQTTTVQAAWHARQQDDFLAWLDRGGMAREAEIAGTAAPIGNSGIAPLFPAPVAGADEELQFSQVRVRDAVR